MQKNNTGISVSYCRPEQASHLHFRVNPDQTVTVIVPEKTSDEEAQNYLQSQLPEVQKLLRFERNKKELLKNPIFCSWSEEQVGDYLMKRLRELSCHYQLPYRSASISFESRIWGSCSGRNHITINFNVAILPERLRDYLFLHELVHTKVRGHGEDFWWELDVYTNGKARELQRELYRYRMKVTL